VLGAAAQHFKPPAAASASCSSTSRLRRPPFRRAPQRLDATVYRIIAERARDAARPRRPARCCSTARDDDGGAMSDLQLRDEAMTLFLAGHETTANRSRGPVAARAAPGRRGTAARRGRRCSPRADARRRRAPPLHAAGGGRVDAPLPAGVRARRRALEPYQLGSWRSRRARSCSPASGYVHRDPRFWPTHALRPRALARRRGRPRRPRFAYFPFGAGTRVCVGEHFAWTEAILVLATLAQRVRSSPGPPARPTPRPARS
jgi:cytochrome P450